MTYQKGKERKGKERKGKERKVMKIDVYSQQQH
jgi:hypothetical protein